MIIPGQLDWTKREGDSHFFSICGTLLDMLWVGLTGGIASGKTTVANFLREMAIPVVDADQLAHMVLKRNKDKVVNYFGPDILGEDGEINRRKLGEKVFSNPKLKQSLEDMIHPLVQEKVAEKKRLFEIGGHALAIYDVPLLYEKELDKQFDHVLLVYVPESVSKKRLMERNSLSEEEADARISNQIDIESKKNRADTVLNNEGDVDCLRAQVEKWKKTILE
ncbi:MAG: dephospho-CoA kinase [Pseudomonadota bacterium]